MIIDTTKMDLVYLDSKKSDHHRQARILAMKRVVGKVHSTYFYKQIMI